MTRRLVVTADDVGLDEGMTAGALRAHTEGIVTACSVVASGRAFDDAVRRLRDAPALEVGVHLTLVEERPLTGLRFPRKYTTFVPAWLAGRIRPAEVELELRAQIDRVIDSGLPVGHLNGHQHLHLLPGIFAIVRRLARERSIPYVRIVDDRGGDRRGFSMALLSRLGRRARTPGLTNDATIGVACAGSLTAVAPLLDSVPEGVTELVTHPGIAVGGYGSWRYAWDRETDALCDPMLRAALDRRGIELVTPSQAMR